jgi:hypothetical protein
MSDQAPASSQASDQGSEWVNKTHTAIIDHGATAICQFKHVHICSTLCKVLKLKELSDIPDNTQKYKGVK